MEAGNREEEDRLGTIPPPHIHSHNNHQQHHHHHQPNLSYSYLEPDDHNRPPQPTTQHFPASPVTSYAIHNSAANSAHSATTAAAASGQANAFGAVNPDDFYRSYRGVQSSTNPTSPSAENVYMATSVSRNREQQPLRASGNGTTPKQPPPPVARNGINGVRPSARSVSAPIDERLRSGAATSPSASQPSVKDLKKKFDQNVPTSITRVPVRTGVPTRPTRAATSGEKPAYMGNGGQTSYSALRTSSNRELTPEMGKGTMNRGTQRTKFAVEDQMSNNSQSFASRIGKPRTAIAGNPQASKSMTHLPHNVSPQLPPSSPTSPSPHGLLFGEILPEQRDNLTVGYGIEGSGVRPRRTSESNLHLAKAHQRSFSDPDIEPSSPTDWYRIASSQPNGVPSQPSHIPRSHIRAHSDVAATKIGSPLARKGPTIPPPTEPARALSPTSRLPLSVRKLNSPTNSTSPPSTRSHSRANSRSNSPSNYKRSQANGKNSRTATPVGRAKTPTQATTSGRKPAPHGLITPNNNTRLTAYVATPPPKLSPPLRSSRPRQSVSTATTASSRLKAIDRAKSPARNPPRSAPSTTEPTTRRRKISVGPIDFEQRREHIRLAYSKSIRESQAKEARQQAADRRRKELEAAARAKAAAAAISQARIDLETVEDVSPTQSEPHPPSLKVSITRSQSIPPVPPLPTIDSDSPTLGIPGSFPAMSPQLEVDEVPQSAVSAATETTEFDNETQTLPPFHTESPTGLGLTNTADIIRQPPQHEPTSARPKTEYQYPFEDEPGSADRVSIKISLDATSAHLSPEPTPTRSEYEEPLVPGAYKEEEEEYEPVPYSSPSYETKVRILRRESDYEHIRPESTAFPNIDEYEEVDYQMKLDHVDASTIRSISQQEEDATTDACTEATDEQDRTEEYFAVRHLRDQLRDNDSSHRASTCESDMMDDLQPTTVESHLTPDTTHSLMVPSMLSPANRSSQISTWTDFSIDSNDPADQPLRISSLRDDALPLPNPPFASESRYGSGSSGTSSARQSGLYSPEFSPLDGTDSQPSSFPAKHQLPELDTGEGFSIPYLSPRGSRSLSYVPIPDHEPPPVPTPGSASLYESRRRAPSSSYWPDTRPGSTLVGSSRRESEDLTQSISTPHSLDLMSMETKDQQFGVQTPIESDVKSLTASELSKEKEGPTGKERHRLLQRRNVIKELIDTEAVFVRDMNIIEEIYKGTAEACPRLDDKTIKLIFRNTDEIITFHTTFLSQLKEAVTSVYTPQGRRSPNPKEDSAMSESTISTSHSQPPVTEIDDAKDRTTGIGPVFKKNIDRMKTAHEGFLRNSDHAAKRLIQIQQDPTVKVWLNECNEVAKDLTAAWDLDSLLIKPMQRITKYPNLVITLLQHTPQDHPDRAALLSAKEVLETAIIEINKTKKNFELVGQIVGRKRKESDVKAGFARAFGKRVDKLQASSNRPPEDVVYAKLHDKFGDDYLRLQVVLRDVEFYTRQVTAYVHEFLQYLSSMELVMRLQPGGYPELESKWVQFNVSMRDIEKVALEQHLSQVRKHVIEPFELVIKAYGNPSLAMKKRAKRRLDYERWEQLRKGGKSVDAKLKELVEQYDALNETLKKELPKLSALTEKIGNICLGNFVNIQANWYSIWRDKVKVVLGDSTQIPELRDIVSTFQHDFKYTQEHFVNIGILNPAYKGRASQSTTASTDDGLLKIKTRPSDLSSSRGRGLSLNSDQVPVLPTPDFAKRHSGGFTLSPNTALPSPHQYYYKDYYSGIHGQRPPGSGSPITGEPSPGARSMPPPGSARPGTGMSYDSSGAPRQSSESNTHNRRDSNSTYNSNYPGPETRRFSGLFHSALPLPDSVDESQRSSRASSRERAPATNGYNVLWLAASLFEFNIETTKHEAGYPYLTYQAGEIFDVIAEKGELWLAKNQDDPNDQVGWIWSKHFAKLADS